MACRLAVDKPSVEPTMTEFTGASSKSPGRNELLDLSFHLCFTLYLLISWAYSSLVAWHNGFFFNCETFPILLWWSSMTNVMYVYMFCSYIWFLFWVCVRFCSQESLIILYVNQMDELDNLGPGAPSTNDLNNILHSSMDDPNNEVRTYSDSLYIPTDNIENILSKYPNNFSVFSLNIQSLNSKFDSLLAFLLHLDAARCGYNFDAICLRETWLSPKCDTSFLNIPGYHLIHQGKTCSQHSGLIIYLSDKFSYSIKDIQVKSELWDEQFIDVHGENLKGKITIGNIYRPPRSNNNSVTLRKFISEINPVISNIAHENNCSIITGDFRYEPSTNKRESWNSEILWFVCDSRFFSENYTTNATLKVQCVSHWPTFLQVEQS